MADPNIAKELGTLVERTKQGARMDKLNVEFPALEKNSDLLITDEKQVIAEKQVGPVDQVVPGNQVVSEDSPHDYLDAPINLWFSKSEDDYVGNTVSQAEADAFLKTQTARAFAEGGQDPLVALAMNAKLKHPDDPHDVDESKLLDPKSNQGKIWNYSSRVVGEWYKQRRAKLNEPGADPFNSGRTSMDLTTGSDWTKLETDSDWSQAGLNLVGAAHWRMASMASLYGNADEMPPEVQVALAGLLDMYKRLPDFTWSGTGRAAYGIITDPFSWIGTLAGTKFFRWLLSGGAKEGGKHALRNSLLKKAFGSALAKKAAGSVLVAPEGAGYTAAYSMMMQKLEAYGDYDHITYGTEDFELNWEQVREHAYIGFAGAGALTFGMTAGIPAVGKLVKKVWGLTDLVSKDPSVIRMFAGPLSETADKVALKTAQDMETGGASREEIWAATGWWNQSGKWTYEISDEAMGLNLPKVAEGDVRSLATKASKSIEHEELFKAYPWLSKTLVTQFDPGRRTTFPKGSAQAGERLPEGGFDTKSNQLIVTARPKGDDYKQIKDPEVKAETQTEIVAHEVQHVIQQHEGFASGGSPSALKLDTPEIQAALDKQIKNIVDEELGKQSGMQMLADVPGMKSKLAAYEKKVKKHAATAGAHRVYERLAGEVGARLTEKRLRMTAAERRARPPWEDLDVPENEIIYNYTAKDALHVATLANVKAPPAPKMTRVEALADTRQQGDIVAERLNVLVPVETRIAGGGKYKPGQPNSGKPWSALTETQLAEPGPGFKGNDNDLSKMLDDAISNSSAAAQDSAQKTGMNITLTAADFDKALKLPKSAQLWYELGGEGLRNKIPILKNDKLFSLVNDVLGVTSPLTKPLDNLKRTLATLSQHLRKEPMDVDVVNPAGIRDALARSAGRIISAVQSGNKTGNFSDTLSLVGGANVPAPIPVNDVWVGKLFGLTEEQLMNNQSLHEPMALFFNKLRDHVNATSGKALPHESWQIQARAWVSERGAQDDYAQALSTIVSELREAGIPGITKDGKITEQALKHPDFAPALRPTMEGFRKAAVATVEVGTKQTPEGREAAASIIKLRKMGTNPQAVKLVDDFTGIHTNALYHATRGPGNMFDRVYQAVLGLPKGARITRISRPNRDRPFDVAGSFNGVFSPNVRIPLRGMSDDQVAIFNAIAGAGLRQDAMASSRIATVSSSAPVVKGKTRGLSVFIETAETIDGKIIQDFLKRLPKGFEISTDRVANGYVIDVNPKFTKAGAKGITDTQIGKAMRMLHAKNLNARPLFHDHSSVYNEVGEFAALEAKFRQELKDGVIKELGEKLGWTEARAKAYIDGRGMGKVTHAQRSRANTARSRYQGQLGDIDAAAKASGEISESVNISYTLWNEKVKKFLATKTLPKVTQKSVQSPRPPRPPGEPRPSQIDMRIRETAFGNDVRAGIITEDTPGVDPAEVRAILAQL